SFNFWLDINSHHLVVDPNAEVTLLLEKIEKRARRGLRRNCNPKRDENILSGAVFEYLIGNRLRVLGADFAATVRAERFRNVWPEQLQIIVDLRHCPDRRTRGLDRVGLLDGYRWGNAANIVHARFVHAVEELPHVGTERLDVTALSFGVNRLECQR